MICVWDSSYMRMGEGKRGWCHPPMADNYRGLTGTSGKLLRIRRDFTCFARFGKLGKGARLCTFFLQIHYD